jgi:hypothetical protein
VRGVGEYRGEKPPADDVEDAEQESGGDSPERPHQVAPVRTDVHDPEQDRGRHEAELLLDRAPEEDLLADAGEEGDQEQAAAAGAVDEARRELLGYRPQGGQEPVGEQPGGDGGERGQGPQGEAQGYGVTGEPEVEPAQGGPQRSRDGQ